MTNEETNEKESWWKKYKMNGLMIVFGFLFLISWNLSLEHDVGERVQVGSDYIENEVRWTLNEWEVPKADHGHGGGTSYPDFDIMVDAEERVSWQCIKWYGSCGEMTLNEDTRIMAPYGYFNKEECTGACADYTLHKMAVLPTLTKTENNSFEMKLANGTVIKIEGVVNDSLNESDV